MKTTPPPAEERFSRLYSRITGRVTSVAEPAQRAGAEEAAVQEKIVRCLWFDQFLDSGNLRTEDGRKLAVFSPGYWNEGAGPDFRNAEFALGDEPRVRGDVEVHVAASDWNRHGHASDRAYGRVLLHVVLRNDLGDATVAQGERRVPQLALDRRLSADLGEILRSLDPDGYPRVGSGREGACCRSIRACGREAPWVGRFLDIAGDERMLRKAERFAALTEQSTPDDVLYDALMEGMGYTANRRPFRLLAQGIRPAALRKLAPADGDFRERLLAVQALLFGAAGFLEARDPFPRSEPRSEAEDSAQGRPAFGSEAQARREHRRTGDGYNDRDTADYLKALRARWEASKVDVPAAALDRTSWSLRRTRPANHPVRRIAGISAFLAANLHSGLCRAMMCAVEGIPTGGPESRRCARTLKSFHQAFEEPPQEYWVRRTGFGAKSLRQPTALIGSARTTELIVNVVVPFLLALSRGGEQPRVEQRLHNVYSSLRPLSDNSITRYMKTRIFQDERSADEVVRSMRRQQGLMQIFHDYCESDSTTCESCGFLSAVEGWVE